MSQNLRKRRVIRECDVCSRLLNALGFDMPTCEVVLEHANKTFFRFFTQFCTANMTKRKYKQSFRRDRQAGRKDGKEKTEVNT